MHLQILILPEDWVSHDLVDVLVIRSSLTQSCPQQPTKGERQRSHSYSNTDTLPAQG